MKLTEIIKAKLKEIEKKYKIKVLRVDKLKKEKVILIDTYDWRDFKKAIKESLLSGIQIAIKSELEFLEELKRYKFKCGFMERELCEVFEDNESISERITELKNALKLIEVGK